GYLGLMVGYFVYYYLYAGNWDYYFSGVWNRDPDQLGALMNPGLYLFGQAIALPKLLAVPLVLGAFTLAAIGLGTGLTRRAKVWPRLTFLGDDRIQHRAFAIVTFIAFNFFFFFAGRPLLRLTPGWVQFGFDGLVLFLSTLWLQRSWRRSPDRYARENLANRLRKQLTKLKLDVAPLLDGRSLDDLHADEVYVLAKVLPDFTREKRHQAYKGVVREALAEGYIDTANSLDVLQQMRQELGISGDEHQEVLAELGVEDPELLNPQRQRSLENQVRISGYRRSLERLLRLQQTQPDLMAEANAPLTLQSLRQEYAITPQEEEWILNGIAGPQDSQRAAGLLARLRDWRVYDYALTRPELRPHAAGVALLREAVRHKQEVILRSLLETLIVLPDAEALAIATELSQLAPPPLADQLQSETIVGQLSPEISARLRSAPDETTVNPPTAEDTVGYLENLLDHYNPLVPPVALYLMAQLSLPRARAASQSPIQGANPLFTATAAAIQSSPAAPPLADIPELEKVVALFISDFFHALEPQTLLALGDRAEVRTYAPGEAITHAGDTCRELLILLTGEASIHYQQAEDVRIERFHPGQTLDELEVLTHSHLDSAILADSENTRILAIPVDAFDALIDQDANFARRVIALESQRLRQITASSPA
ncbi:MAG: cyclic nucleotide-binding domain-containing protein, partial [Cyanobacteria bacterium J06638_6]